MLRFQTDDGAWLAYRDQGEGLPVLALPGLTRDGHDFDYLARHLDDIRLIRLDYRGRGGSDWTGAETYTIPREARDVVLLLDHLRLRRAAVIGSSRGGVIGMFLAATARDRLSGLCLNDVGPVLEREGLERIGRYVGQRPTVSTLEEIADRMPAAMPGFDNVPPRRWREETIRHYVQNSDGIGLSYDPDLRLSLEAAMAAPAVDAWPLFDACAGMPLVLIRGANSDVLGIETVQEMRRRRPDMRFANVPDRGHIPFLDEPEALSSIGAWIGDMRQATVAANGGVS